MESGRLKIRASLLAERLLYLAAKYHVIASVGELDQRRTPGVPPLCHDDRVTPTFGRTRYIQHGRVEYYKPCLSLLTTHHLEPLRSTRGLLGTPLTRSSCA